MFSKFDVQISSEELHIHEPTEADIAEYHAWLDEQEADEEEVYEEANLDGKVYGQNNMNEYLTKYDYVILKRLSTDSTLRIKTPRTINKNETVGQVPSDIWDWLCLEFGEYNGNFVFFQYEG